MTGDGLLRLPDGRWLQYLELGAPEGDPLIFLPGCPDSRCIARTGEAVAVAEGVRLIAVNRPGYGASEAHASTHVSVADDVAALCDHFQIERFSVIGMSLGGPYALACAARHPHRVRAVGIVASPAMPTALTPPFHRDDLGSEQQALFRQVAAGSVQAAIALLTPEYASWVRRISPDDSDDGALAQRWLDSMSASDRSVVAGWPPEALAAAAREALAQLDGYLRDAALTFRDWDFSLEDVACPVHLWYGGADENVSLRNAEWLTAALRLPTVSILPQASHLQLLVENWSVFFTAVRPHAL